LQTLALAITFGATLTIRWLKPRDHWITFRAEAERLRSRIFDAILSAAPPAGSDAAATASQRLGLTMSAFVDDQMKFFKKRAVQHGRVASHLSPLRIFGYLLILAAGILGIAAVVNEGITIVTPQVNKAFLDRALSAPRTLVGDALSKSGKKPIVEGFAGDKRVFSDATRTVEIHVIKGLPHADGLVVGYLPKEKILIYADMFNLPPANGPQVPNPPVVGTMVFADNITRLNLTPDRIMSVHSLNPDRLTSVAELNATLGRK
jgi:hypothetical protein